MLELFRYIQALLDSMYPYIGGLQDLVDVAERKVERLFVHFIYWQKRNNFGTNFDLGEC